MLELTRNNQQRKNTFASDKTKLFDLLHPIRQWLNQLEIKNIAMAHLLCRVIPTQCPFERDIYLFGRQIGHIPPLCKLNPLYEEVVSLRFRALCYLADECDEDVRCYCWRYIGRHHSNKSSSDSSLSPGQNEKSNACSNSSFSLCPLNKTACSVSQDRA